MSKAQLMLGCWLVTFLLMTFVAGRLHLSSDMIFLCVTLIWIGMAIVKAIEKNGDRQR